MDLTEFRATYPGFYEQARAEGFREHQQLAKQHVRLAEAAGTSAHEAIAHGLTVDEALPEYRDAASSSDATSTAFLSELEKLRPANAQGAASASPSASNGKPSSLLDVMAADLDRAPAARATPPRSAAVSAARSPVRDLVSLFESDLPSKAAAE